MQEPATTTAKLLLEFAMLGLGGTLIQQRFVFTNRKPEGCHEDHTHTLGQGMAWGTCASSDVDRLQLPSSLTVGQAGRG